MSQRGVLVKLIKRGAEGDIFESVWGGKRCIIKERKPKAYRNEMLDYKIRRSRTIHESEIIQQAKSVGVPTPLVYFVDVMQCRIYLQYIKGKMIKDLSDKDLIKACWTVGIMTGTMHKNSLMHGDLTTSNFIVHDRIHAIDFGLSIRTAKPEDHAIDLRLLKEILSSAHTGIMEDAWRNFTVGYGSIVGQARLEKITKLVSVIEGRGRYAKVV